MGRVRIAPIVLVLVASAAFLDARLFGSVVPREVRLWHGVDVVRVHLPRSQVSKPLKPEVAVVAIRRVHLGAAPPIDGSPIARVTFEIHNTGKHGLMDIVLTVSLLEPPPLNDPDAERAVVAGPLTIRSKSLLLPGYSLGYNITLRNISSECRCVPVVNVIQARFVLPTYEL